MRKIAIPSRNDNVDEHFGHCEYYTIYSINEKNEILNKEKMNSPQICGCKSGIATILSSKGVSVMLAGNIGAGAIQVLESSGIKIIKGCSGEVGNVIMQYLDGDIIDNGLTCSQHGNCDH